MSKTFVYLPTQLDKVPAHEVGTYAVELSKLKQTGALLPKHIVIPQNTLKLIAQANNLQAKAYKLIQEINYSSDAYKKLNHLITRQSIPKNLAEELLKTYHEYFNKSFVLIKNSEKLPFNDITTNHIHSDTNFVNAVLETWAEISSTKLKKLLSGTNDIHNILFPCPILVQEQLEPKASGIAYSYDLADGNKNRVTILSSWGVFHSDQEDYDQFNVDTRTFNTISKKTKTKQTQFRRILGKLKTDDVLVKYQNRETLTSDQLRELTKIVAKIRRNYLHQIQINWGIQDDKIYIESVKEADLDIHINKSKTKTLIKLFTTVTSTNNLSKLNNNVDGLVVNNAGRLLSASGTHPNEVVKTKQKKYLIEATARTLLKYIKKTNKPLIYRANNFTSTQFNKLKFASLYEVPESNPFLGFRGGLRHISQPEAFKLELAALSNVLNNTKEQITLVLPFVRSPDELAHLLSLINKQGLTNFSNFSTYLELSTVENILNLSQYPTKNIQGVVFNTKNIHALATGIDPNNTDIASHYNLNTAMIKLLVETTIKTLNQTSKTQLLNQKPKLLIDLTNYNKELFEQLCDLKIHGFIINEQVTEYAKKCIIDRQHNKLLMR